MRRFCVMLAPALLAISVAGFAQAPTTGAGGTPEPAPPAGAATAAPTPPTAAASSGVAGTTSPAVPVVVDAATYVIGPQDGLSVTVWKDATLSGTFPVRPDGMISLTLIGDVQAAGLTPMELGASITEKLKKFIQDPIVSVVVTAVNSKVIYVVGEVGKTGPIGMTPNMTALQAIATAGGLSVFAHSKNIYILRGKAQQHIPFDYKKALKGDPKQQISLQPGDTIVVP
jgi:polysaccharide export outer membrane protein